MSATTIPETSIVADPDVPLVRITREFDAPPHRVFQAHADPALFAQWNGPHSLRTEVDHHDCRSGGAYRYHLVGEEGTFGFRGSFHEVRSGELIVQTFAFDGVPDGVALERITFEPLDGGRTRLTATSLVDSFEARDGFLASGMETGVRDGYERLDTLLAP